MTAATGALATLRALNLADPSQRPDLNRAIAAVAELIDATKESREATQEFANDGQPANWVRYEASEKRIVAALSSIQGGAA